VAVSGGSDSVGLLRALHALAPGLGLELSVAHLDHGARGEAGRRDAAFVSELAGSLGLPCDLGEWAPTRPAHFEADARRARYAWLTDVARGRGAAAVAVGHTRDDQAETILHRVVRGTGLRGLAGIPRRRPLAAGLTLVRPLLDVGRDDIRAYLAACGQPFRDDATNADVARTRARIRHELLPRLAADYNPKVADALVRLGSFAEASERLRGRGHRACLRVALVEAGAERIVLRRRPLAGMHPHESAEVVRLAWRRAGWPERGMRAEHWGALGGLARADAGRVQVAGGAEGRAERGRLVLTRRAAADPVTPPVREAAPLPVPGATPWGSGRVVATLGPEAPRDETVDLDALVLPLVVRAPAAGDRFDPLGMDGHTTPLSDFLRGRRVPRSGRGAVPLVCDQAGIVWVVGHRIAHRVRTRRTTARPVGLRWVEGALDREVPGAGCD
jgi:tRNA(Ile)-lysidine synthase